MEDNKDDILLGDQILQHFFDLQRIKNAEDRDKEIEYQERILKERMKQLGISVEEIEKLLLV